MKDHRTSIELRQRVDEYFAFRDRGDAYAALLRLAELHHCRKLLSVALVKELDSALTPSTLDPTLSESVVRRAKDQAARIERIVTVGSNFLDDEILLVMTLRVQLELLTTLLQDLYAIDLGIDFDQMDAWIREAFCRPRLGQKLQEVLAQMRRNWGLPIESHWLSSERRHIS